jgi:methionyl-tRNA formyltransferase
MRTVFIGASKFGLRCLDLCCETKEIEIAGVVTAPQVFPISYRPSGVTNVLYADVATFAEDKGIPCEVITRGMGDEKLFQAVESWRPEAFLVAGWYHMVPSRWRNLAPGYGLHASLLPDYSGGAPLVWAMINGERETGITLFQMDDGVDSGPILGQLSEPIRPDDTIATLYARIEDRGLELLKKALPEMAIGAINLIPQDNDLRRIMPQRSPDDGHLDWQSSVAAIDRFVRAQTRPYPGAFSFLGGRHLTIWSGRPTGIPDAGLPGTVYQVGGGAYAVGCRDGAFLLEEVGVGQHSYAGADLIELFGEGGQVLQ